MKDLRFRVSSLVGIRVWDQHGVLVWPGIWSRWWYVEGSRFKVWGLRLRVKCCLRFRV